MANYDYDNYEEEPPSENRFMMLPAGAVVGFAFGPLYYSYPDFYLRAKDALKTTILLYVPDNPEYATYIMIGLLLVALFLLRGILKKIWMLLGMALGVALWIPLGAHMAYYMPVVNSFFPKAEPHLTLIVARNDKFTAARNWAVETFPLPPQVVPSLTDALAAATTAPATETTN